MKRVDGLICWPVGQRRGKLTTERAQQTGRRLTIPVLPSTQHSIQPSAQFLPLPLPPWPTHSLLPNPSLPFPSLIASPSPSP